MKPIRFFCPFRILKRSSIARPNHTKAGSRHGRPRSVKAMKYHRIKKSKDRQLKAIVKEVEMIDRPQARSQVFDMLPATASCAAYKPCRFRLAHPEHDICPSHGWRTSHYTNKVQSAAAADALLRFPISLSIMTVTMEIIMF